MRIVDEITEQETTNPDLAVGELIYSPNWVSTAKREEAMAAGLDILPDDSYEEVQLYHVWTPSEIAQREEAERQAEHQELMDTMPDAVADLSKMVSDNTIDTADLQDALAELSEIVSGLME